MCTRDFLAQEFLCALFLVGKFGGEEVVGEKWGVWYHIVLSFFLFFSLITSYLVKWCGVPEVVVHIILY